MTGEEKELQDALRPHYSLIRYLSEYNATRHCSICSEDASFYLYTDGEHNDFRCLNHARALVEDGNARQNGTRADGSGLDGE